MKQSLPSSKPLIEPVAGSVPDAPPVAAELAFLVDVERRWNLHLNGPVIGTFDALAQAVAAQPAALEWHLRRIHYCYSLRDGDELFGALLDLFIFLGGRGHALRRRLLAGARDLLRPAEFAALESSLSEGRMPTETERPCSPQSVLSEGLQGSLELVKPLSPTGQGALRDALVEAREFIEFSQLEQARDVLEVALLRQPLREDLQHELLALYRATRDEESFVRMRENLREALGTVPADWDRLDRPKGGDQLS